MSQLFRDVLKAFVAKPFKSLLFSAMLVVFFVSHAPLASAQPDLPDLEMFTSDVKGTVELKRDTGGGWLPVKPDMILNRGDQLRTGEAGSVTLEVPGVSYLKVTPNTEMEVQNLGRRTEQRGLLTTEDITVNEIELETTRGKLQNSVRKRDGVATEYELNTNNAVAGVRGTSFQCEVDQFGRTECGVGEGEVEFRSRANPEAMVNLQAGQKSGIGPDATEPEEPQPLSEEESEELKQVEEESQSALLMPPTIEDLELNGTSLEESIRFEYTEETELTLTGSAVPQEDETEIVSVEARINGEPVEVSGLEDWAITGTPEVPEEGTESVETIEIRVTDSNEKSSMVTLTATLVNPEQTGAVPTEIPPETYEEGNVPVEVASIAGRPAGNLEFPFHAYRGDVTGDGLMIEGTASGNATIEGVAYSLDGGQSWELADGAENWFFTIPAQQSGEYSPRIVAWTVDGVIGEPLELETIRYETITYNRAMQNVFKAQWDAFEREDAAGFIEFTSRDFLFEDPFTEEQFTRNEFQRFFEKEFEIMSNLRVRTIVNNVLGGPSGGDLSAVVEWRGVLEPPEFDDGGNTNTNTNTTPQPQSFPFIALSDDAKFLYQREPDGQFRLISFEDFEPKFFRFRDNITLDLVKGEGIDVFGLTKSADFATITADTSLNFEYFQGNFDGEGGITRVPGLTVSSIPTRSSGAYALTKPIETGVYAINIKNCTNCGQVSLLIDVVNVTSLSVDVRLFGGVSAPPGESEEGITQYPGLNPFR